MSPMNFETQANPDGVDFKLRDFVCVEKMAARAILLVNRCCSHRKQLVSDRLASSVTNMQHPLKYQL